VLQTAESAGSGSTADGVPYSGDAVSITGTAIGTYNSKDVGTAKPVTYGGLSLTGAQAGDYSLTIQSPTSADITPKALTAVGTLVFPATKVYDGTRTATPTSGAAALQGTETAGTGSASDGKPYSVDSVSLTGTAAYNYNSKDVTSATTVTESGLSLTGTGNGDYTLTAPSFSSRITPQPLTASIIGNPNKPFDGNNTATLTSANFKLSGLVGNESFTVTKTSGTYNTNDWTANTVTASLAPTDFTAASGTLASDYTLPTTASGPGYIWAENTNVSVAAVGVQYSDPVTLSATISTATLGGQALTGTVAFYVNGDSTADASASVSSSSSTSVTVTATTGQIFLAPGSYSVKAVFTSANSDFACSNATNNKALTVNQEDARVTYNGDLFVSTPSSTNPSATVTLRATIQDITAVTGDPAYDPYAGDIRNATVTFVNRDTNTAIGTVGYGTLTPISLVNPSDPTTGTVALPWTVTITGTASSVSPTVGIIVGQSYSPGAAIVAPPANNAGSYVRNSSSDVPTVITVSLPLTTGFITGGGYLVASSSCGTYAATTGTKENFGFNVKFNKSGTNLQGSLNTIVQSGGKDYQIKSNSISSLSINGSAQNQATFVAKANLTDITNPNNTISIGGGYTLNVTMTDNGDPGHWTTPDTIGITLWNGSTLLFSSNWNGTNTVEQALDNGTGKGNVVVHHAQMVAGGPAAISTGTSDLTQQTLQPIVAQAITEWQVAGVPAGALAILRQTPFQIADLPGGYVGRESANGVVVLDPNAAGYGWYTGGTKGNPVVGELDLLTVVAHELGHVLGIAELNDPSDVMNESLALGQRKTPTTADVMIAGLQPTNIQPTPVGSNSSSQSNAWKASVVADEVLPGRTQLPTGLSKGIADTLSVDGNYAVVRQQFASQATPSEPGVAVLAIPQSAASSLVTSTRPTGRPSQPSAAAAVRARTILVNYDANRPSNADVHDMALSLWTPRDRRSGRGKRSS
jgi:hypothetical protein